MSVENDAALTLARQKYQLLEKDLEKTSRTLESLRRKMLSSVERLRLYTKSAELSEHDLEKLNGITEILAHDTGFDEMQILTCIGKT